ncbi:MAG: penicillin-binding protein 2 [Piscirickettsiaceae bacterium]|nr:penicillin-binding protein 2 [Piscirickettsiaceae bacterium]
MKEQKKTLGYVSVWRLHLVRFILIVLVSGLGCRLVYIQILDIDFLRDQGVARHIRKVPIAVHRGMILDRYGEPLAISTPVYSVWLNPQEVDPNDQDLKHLAEIIGIRVSGIRKRIARYDKRKFIYIKRLLMPELSAKVRHLNIAGVGLQREYKRYYPTGEVTSHLIGFTNVDDVGQEGLELVHNHVLGGLPGLKRMIRDSHGSYVGGGEQLRAAKIGQNIILSIDLRLQYLTYQALKSAVIKFHAHSGTAVILDINTGEVLAMVNQPSFNPNNSHSSKISNFRNRAVTDVFEPGSTVKPFIVAGSLESGKFNLTSKIDTRPGAFKVGGHIIKDSRNYGEINLSTLIQKSSNVAASKIALALEPEELWQSFSAFGLTEATGAYFPGEAIGNMPDPQTWQRLDRAALAYGYGVTTTSLQLARAYSVLANGGILRPVSFLKTDELSSMGRRVYSTNVMKQVLTMMEKVVQVGGTAQKAAVTNYTVAGKTGTIKKATSGGYSDDQYISSFAGVIPAKNPRLSMVITVDSPRGNRYYGGLVAAPVFSEVMTIAMRLLDIAPDNFPIADIKLMRK